MKLIKLALYFMLEVRKISNLSSQWKEISDLLRGFPSWENKP
jgi:hypothetical protein